MDCEKFEPLLLDELYGELDELTSAALKRHAAGCSRCAGALDEMKATRRAAALPFVPVPEGLEERILAAAKEAQNVVPFRSRMSRALSIAGAWAMRPQTAMAAVFLLMIGTSAFLIRSKGHPSADASRVSVTVQGAPAPVAAVAESESLDDKAAAAAHGPSAPTAAPVATVAAVAASAAADPGGSGPMDPLTGFGARDRGNADESSALGSSRAESPAKKGVAAAAPSLPRPTAPAGAPPSDAVDRAPATAYAKQVATEPSAQDPFSLGAAAFRARNFTEAAQKFDLAAQGGDDNAALWAAQSVREGSGCAAALGRFDQLAQRAAGSWVGSEASLRAARCQMDMGQLDAARARLGKLTQVASHRQAAEEALGELDAIAAGGARARSGGAAVGGGGAVAAPRAAPARAPAAQEQKKPANAMGDR